MLHALACKLSLRAIGAAAAMMAAHALPTAEGWMPTGSVLASDWLISNPAQCQMLLALPKRAQLSKLQQSRVLMWEQSSLLHCAT